MIFLRHPAGIAKAAAIASVFAIPVFFCACDRITPLPKTIPTIDSRVPAGNELYVFPHGRLEMSAFEALRSAFPEVAPVDLARIAMASQWLQSKTLPGKSASLEETTRCVRALFLPKLSAEAGRTASLFISDRFGFATLDLLRQSFDDAARVWAVEWNPSLVREYGISIRPH